MTSTEMEIRGTPEILLSSLEEKVDVDRLKGYIEDVDEILFLGCGSSYHLGTVLSHYVTRHLKKPTRTLIGSEALLSLNSNILNDKKYLVVAISRSGETTETVLATEKLKEKNPTVGMTCSTDSTLEGMVDMSIVSPSREESLVMTQSFSSLLLIFIKAVMEMINFDTSPLKKCVEDSRKVLEKSFEIFQGMDLSRFDHFVFRGTGENWGLSNEAALKVKEMSVSFAESHSALDYRHGPKALIGKSSLVLIQLTDEDRDHLRKLREELEGFGAKVVDVGPGGDVDLDCGLPRGSDAFLRTIPFQVLALEVAKTKGLNPDSPDKLTKVVKLE